MTKQRFIEMVRQSPISHLEEVIVSALQPSIRLRTERVELSALALGASRMGGVPDLPRGVEWPRSADGPLTFIAQLQLADFHGLDPTGLLPPTGWLFFFYDMSDQPWGHEPGHRQGRRVLFYDGPAESLCRSQAPGAPTEETPMPCRLTAQMEDSFPDSAELITEGVLNPEHEDFGEYFDLLDRFNKLREEDACRHRLLGRPDVIQGEMRWTCQMVSHGITCGHPSVLEDPRVEALTPGVREWVLLLQVDTDEDGPGWMWCDCGRLFWWIRKQDLAARRFDDAWVMLQCS